MKPTLSEMAKAETDMHATAMQRAGKPSVSALELRDSWARGAWKGTLIMFENIARRHPAWCDALLWALPAMIFGAVLRGMLLAYQPMAYWGSDSESYYSFAYRLWHEGVFSIPEKRRLIYPLLLFPVVSLPGSPLRWLAVIQHALGVLTLIPLAYVIRRIFAGWKAWIVPLTVLYTGLPILLWYEHELLGEAFFFYSIVWAFAGWVAWQAHVPALCGQGQQGGGRTTVAWWVFLAALALCVLTKPAGRFLWPGLLLGLVYIRAWQSLRWFEWVALALVFVLSWSVGQGAQASRLLYRTAFPLTNMESPLHAELKREIAPLVRDARGRLDTYYSDDSIAKAFLEHDFGNGRYPAWEALARRDERARSTAMRELALEAIRTEPFRFLYIGVQRAVASMNWTSFKLDRFSSDYFLDKFKELYRNENDKKVVMLNEVLGLGGTRRLTTAEIRSVLPRWQPVADQMQSYVEAVSSLGVFVNGPSERTNKAKFAHIRVPIWQMAPTVLGWWLIGGIALAIAIPHYRATLGVWVLVAVCYIVGVYLVGSSNPRFFAVIWPFLLLALAVPADALWRWGIQLRGEGVVLSRFKSITPDFPNIKL